ncbi:IS4/Tn5 family transposase DNA-binding protein, partial [[Scytonema hofmanni] UTEX B 1581]
MLDWWEKNFATCELGDRRLNERAMSKSQHAKSAQMVLNRVWGVAEWGVGRRRRGVGCGVWGVG